MLRYKINEYIELKLENNETVIYFNQKKFLKCIYLMFHIDTDDVEKYDEIQSIDEMELHDRSHEYKKLSISPEQEFWGHCSNLQAWVENDYDMRIIDSRLGFPLLSRLKDLGDIIAKKKYKEEFAKKLESGWLPTIEYLWRPAYLKDFTEEERKILLEYMIKATIKSLEKDTHSKKILTRRGYLYLIDDEVKLKFKLVRDLRKKCLEILEKQREFRTYHEAVTIRLEGFANKDKSSIEQQYIEEYNKNRHEKEISLEEILKHLILLGYFGALTMEDIKNHPKLQALESLNLSRYDGPFSLKVFPEGIIHLKSLKHLQVSGFNLYEVPESRFKLTSLKSLDLSDNKIKFLPNSIINLKNLKRLKINDNEITEIPVEIADLTWLEELFIGNNKIKKIPEKIIWKDTIGLRQKGNLLKGGISQFN